MSLHSDFSKPVTRLMNMQGFIQDFLLGVGNFFGKANVLVGGRGGILARVQYHWTRHARGIWGHAPQENFLNLNPLRSLLVHFPSLNEPLTLPSRKIV